MKPIPTHAARDIAEKYGYDQVVIVARKIGDTGGEHVTTYGRDKANCDVAARIGDFFKHKLMGWPLPGEKEGVHLGLLDDMEHDAKYATDAEYRRSELRIQALGAAISRQDWHAVEWAYAAIRDKFYSHSAPRQETCGHEP